MSSSSARSEAKEEKCREKRRKCSDGNSNGKAWTSGDLQRKGHEQQRKGRESFSNATE
nr:MAG TPA: hypothetical protein [Caudoviricetes sp.]